MTADRRPRAGVLAVAVAAALVAGLLAALFVAPRPARLDGSAVTGDATLADATIDALGERGYRGVAAVAVEDGTVSTAGLGAAGVGGSAVTPDTPFEIGSVTKIMTGLLLADAVSRGEVRLNDRVGDLVPGTPLADSAAGDVTLEELATHRSGLPRLGVGPSELGRSLLTRFTGSNPYTADVDDIFAAAAAADATAGRGEYEYSSLGMAVLGHARAARAGMTYQELLADRLFDPLGMDASMVVTAPAELPAGRAVGGSPGGDARAPWIADGYAPAGVGVWSTATDMARLAAAALDGSVPGAASLEPAEDITEDRRIGLAWQITSKRGSEVTWHNGATGGFRAFLGLDREAGRAVVLLSNTSAPLDDAALEVLVPAGTPDDPAGGGVDIRSLLSTAVLLLVLLGAPLWLSVGALRAGRRFGITDRMGLVGGIGQTLAALAIGHALVDWAAVSPAVWSVAAGLGAAGAAVGLLAWRPLPVAGAQAGWRWAGAVVQVVVSLGLIALLALPPAA